MAENGKIFKNHDDAEIVRALASVGANVTNYIAKKTFRCPMCSHTRKKKAERCLSVSSDAEGFVFKCHHCEWSGGSRSAERIERSTAPPPRDNQPTDTIETARRIWRESVDPRGTVVETYLALRCLTLPDEIAGSVLRYHSSLWFDGRRVPGMVALMRDIKTNHGLAIIRTFLDADGQKLGRKMLGAAGSTAVKLSADTDLEQGLHIGEGVETCLAAWSAGYRPVWSVGSAGGIASFPVLSGIEALTILGETSDGGANARAVDTCAARWHQAGAADVYLVEPLSGEDMNDVWRKVVLQ